MKKLFKRTCVLLLVFAMFMSMCSNVFATKLLDGNNGKEIYLSWSYYKKDGANKIPVTQLDDTTSTYYAELSYSNNPTALAEVMASFEFFCDVDKDIVTGITGENNFSRVQDVEYIFAGNVIDGRVFVTGAATNGFVQWSEETEKNESVESAGLFFVRFKVTKTVDADKLKTLFKVAVNENSFISDLNGKSFTIIELPHFAASVKTDADTLYTSSNAEKIASNLTGKIISADGTETTVTSGITVELNGDLTPGKNTVTAKYDGYTCDVEIEVEQDIMESISVTGPTKTSYTSGDTLSLEGFTVTANYKSGTTTTLDEAQYTISPAADTKLTVKDNDGHPITVTATESGKTATTGTLTVSPANIDTVTIDAIGEKEYTGKQIKPEPVVKAADGTALVKGTDYDVEYGTNIELGTNAGSVIIKGKGEYQGETTVYFAIVKATSPLTLTVNESEGPVTISYGDSLTFKGNGTEITSTSTGIWVEYKTANDENSTYTRYNYNTPLSVGEYEFHAYREESQYYKEATSTPPVKVKITAKNIADLNFTVDEQTYGSTGKPTFTVEGFTLTENTDYTLSGYENNTNAGSATFTITGNGNFYGSKELTYTINHKPLGADVIENAFAGVKTPEVVYTGNPYTPEVPESVKIGADTLVKGRDYTVEYTNNTNAGLATITITSKPGSNYTFETITKTFTIKPKQIKINSSQYDWVSYVIDDEIDGYDSDGSGQQSPYFNYDGNMHGIKLQFKDTALANEIKLETLVKCTYTNAVNTNASGYTAYVTLKLNKDYETNYQLLGSSDTPVPDRTLTKTWSIHKATLTNLTPPDLNIRCLELAGEKPVDYTYSLDWLGTGVKPNNLKITLKGLTCDGEPAYDNAGNTITFPQVTAKKADTPTDSVELELGFTNYESINVTIPVKYINKLSVNDKLSMANIKVVYGESYAPVLKLDSTTVTPKTLYKITYTDKDGKPVTNPKNAGTYTIKATYEDDTEETVEGVTYPGHIGTATAELVIKRRPLDVTVWHTSITYGDDKPTSGFSAKFEGELNNEIGQDDFTLGTKYEKGNGAGNYDLTCELKTTVTNYEIRTVTGKLVVDPKPITAATVTISEPEDKTYTGHPRVQGVGQKDTEAKFETYDLSVTYENNINVGTATIIYKGQRNYTGEIKRTFKINPATITEEMIAAIQAVTYTGKAQTPALTIKYNGMTLKEGTDYTVAYTSNTNAGSATATVTGKGNYTGTAEKPFTINKAAMVFDATQTVFRRSTVTGEQTESLQTIKGVQGETLTPTLTLEAPGAQGILASAAIDGTNVKFTITGSEGVANYKVKLDMPSNGNYLNGEYTLKFEVADKNDVSGSITFPNGSSVYTGAPQTYEKATLNPNLAGTWTYTYTASDGSGASLKDGLPLTVGTYRVAASFTNADNVGTANATFVITMATPPTPTEVKVYGEDKTLKDLEDSMRKDLGAIEGEFTWRDSDGKPITEPHNTKIEANKEYEWTFTPTGKDAKNYRPISGKTTPYVRDDLSWLPGVLGGGSTFNFRDVTRYDYFYSAVKWAAENGIASGTSRYTFSPDAVCTRAQTVTFLWRAAGSPMPSYRISPFTDVNYGDYYYNAVLWAVEQGITTGLTATTFGPDKTVTRGQVATFLYRAASAVKPNITNPFTDVKSTAYNYDAILWAYDNRITTGTSTMTFSPDAFCTRAQIVTFLYRFYQGR